MERRNNSLEVEIVMVFLENHGFSLEDYFQMRKVRELLEASGYSVDYKKDSKNGGKHYYLIH